MIMAIVTKLMICVSPFNSLIFMYPFLMHFNFKVKLFMLFVDCYIRAMARQSKYLLNFY